jgi:putative hydrolase of the HAD superfamily
MVAMSPTDSEKNVTPRPRAITFDCWNTLLYEASWKTAHGLRVKALQRAASAAGREVENEIAGRAFDTAWQRHMELWAAGAASGATEVAHWALAELELSPHGANLNDLVRSFEEASHTGRVLALDGARDALEALDRAGIRLGLVCDTGLTPGRVVRQFLDAQGLLGMLASTIFSDEWSLPKPHPEVFRAALSELGVEPSQAVHIGDLRRTDVAGARAVGMATVRLRARNDDQSAHAEADHVVDDYPGFLALFGIDSKPGRVDVNR